MIRASFFLKFNVHTRERGKFELVISASLGEVADKGQTYIKV
jgi:hypothetical protein